MVKLIISEQKIDETLIVNLSGDIVFGDGNVVLRDTIRRLLSEGHKKIVLNMENVGYVDSSGIGEMVSGFIAINREHGSFKLVNVPKRITELLIMCKLLAIFDVTDNTDNAIAR